MNGRNPQSWPENIERVMELGEGNGYAQPWESARKGPSLLAELAEQTGKDIDALTPEERIAFRIGWVRGRIRKYEEAGAVDPAEIAHAKENEEFYRKKLRDILEKPSPSPSPSPTSPEPTPEAPGFSRYLKDILTSSERNNILQKLAGPNGRLWIDKKVKNADGTERTIRIWLSLDLTPEERAKPEDALKKVIEAKLQAAAKNPDLPLPLRFRVDDLSAENSWKEKWTAKKAGISTFVAAIAAAPDAERPAACARIAEALFGTDAVREANRQMFVALLQQYLARPDGKTDIWTHVRNAYWHADEWKNETNAKSDLNGLGVPPASLKSPSYASAKIRVWQKIGEEPREAEIEGKKAPLLYNGTKYAAETIEKTAIADGAQKGTWYHIGPHWVREEHLRISYKYHSDGTKVEPPEFELMVWQVQDKKPEEPKGTQSSKASEKKDAASAKSDDERRVEKEEIARRLRDGNEAVSMPPNTLKNTEELRNWLEQNEGKKLSLRLKVADKQEATPRHFIMQKEVIPEEQGGDGTQIRMCLYFLRENELRQYDGFALSNICIPGSIKDPPQAIDSTNELSGQAAESYLQDSEPNRVPPMEITPENITASWLGSHLNAKVRLRLNNGQEPTVCLIGKAQGTRVTLRSLMAREDYYVQGVWCSEYDIDELRNLNSNNPSARKKKRKKR